MHHIVLLLLLALLPGFSMAQWRVVAVTDEVEAMRFDTIADAHDFMTAYRVEEEAGTGFLVGDWYYATANYSDGRHVSLSCFVYEGSDGDYDPETCTGDPATTYERTTMLYPAEMENSPFLNRDLGKPDTQMCVGNPIHLGTGNKFQRELDYRSGGPDSLSFSRYYNSSLPDSPFGGWRHTYSRSVDFDPNAYGENMVVLHRPEGQQLAFYETANGWEATWTTDDRLEQTGSGWLYVRSDGLAETYDSDGRLTRIEKPAGNVIEVNHSGSQIASVTDSFGRSLTFTGDGNQIDRITVPSGEHIFFGYSAGGQLSTVTYQDASTRSYHYEKDGLLTGITDERGNRYATWDYDDAGRAILSEHAGSADRTEVSYHADGTVSVTNALGHVQTYSFSRHNGKLKPDSVTGAPCTGFAGGTETRIYDSEGFLDEVTDRAGQSRSFNYNTRGLEASRTDRDGGYVTTEWHPDYALPVKVTGPEMVTEYEYDDRLRITSKTISERGVGDSRTWAYTYHPDQSAVPGRLAQIDGPRTDVDDTSTFAYDNQGNLTSITNALGHITRFEDHDAHGRARKIVDANGVAQTLTYDLRGRLTKATGPEGTTVYTYDNAGLLVELEAPNGVVQTYDYDRAQRLIGMTDALGNRRALKLNALGGVTEEKLIDPDGVTRWVESRTFNEIGWLTEVSDAYNNTSDYGYDVVANLVSETDPAGDQYSYDYDGFHHRTGIQDPLGEFTEITYEDTGTVYRVRDPRSRRTYYSYNGFDQVTQVRSPDTGTTTLSYDEAGNLASRTDEKGQVINYSYDALNRLTLVETSDPSEPDVVFTYDESSADFGVGRLTTVNDGNGIRRYDYTPEGLMATETWEISGLALTTAYEYDGAGQVTKITYPSGRTVEYLRDAAGQVESVTTGFEGDSASLIDSIERAPFGPLTGLTWGNSLKESRGLDLNYRVTSIEVPGVTSLDYGYTVDSNIAGIDDLLNSAASQSFDFDPVDRLTEAQGLFGLLEYDYDASGNRTALTRDGQTEDYRIHYGNNQLLDAGPVDNTYDDNGNLTDRGGDLFTYDTQNRLVGASVDGQTALYTYNHQDQRVTKTVAGTTTLFMYDGSGNLIAEVDEATGQTLAEYVWLDDSPVAYVENGQRYQVHVDHLGTPKALTDTAGSIAWEASDSPFGKATITSQGPTFNLRFLGQYYDAETGLHYNWHRYYDPDTGRYITSDPIGLAGGINTYAYVGGNPLSFIDPTGLIRWSDAASATLGLLGNGAGVIVGGALVGAPEPATTVVGGVVLTKSVAGWGLNWYNLTRAFSDDPHYDAPSTLPRAIAGTFSCKPEAQRLADVADLGIDLLAGRLPVGYIPQAGSALDKAVNFGAMNKFMYGRFGDPPINSYVNSMQQWALGQYTYDAYTERNQ